MAIILGAILVLAVVAIVWIALKVSKIMEK